MCYDTTNRVSEKDNDLILILIMFGRKTKLIYIKIYIYTHKKYLS